MFNILKKIVIIIMSADSVNAFKNRLDKIKFWQYT